MNKEMSNKKSVLVLNVILFNLLIFGVSMENALTTQYMHLQVDNKCQNVTF